VSVARDSRSRLDHSDPGPNARFVAAIVAQPDFLSDGFLLGGNSDLQWAVVDPLRHPLGVWKKRATGILSYMRSAQALDAVVFTNGPLMGKRLWGSRKVTRGSVPWLFASSMGGGLFGGVAAAFGSPAQYFAGAGGAALGAAHAWRQSFTNWIPCGTVRSQYSSVDDRRDFDGEGKRHAWLGRSSSEFSSHRIGYGDLPTDMSEGVGGLIMLVQNYEARTKNVDEQTYDYDFALLHRNTGVVAWALVPLSSARAPRLGSVDGEAQTPNGVIVVAGSRDKLNCEDMAAWLCSIGARDAVATDLSKCSMMGAGGNCSIGPPPRHRQALQFYGLYCHRSRDVK
jgi:hypothetical protein